MCYNHIVHILIPMGIHNPGIGSGYDPEPHHTPCSLKGPASAHGTSFHPESWLSNAGTVMNLYLTLYNSNEIKIGSEHLKQLTPVFSFTTRTIAIS